MKVLHRYIIKSFLGPLALTLIISLFVLLMRFIFVYIDDVVGKGLSWDIIYKFMALVTITLIPMALPLAILFASIMTFGNLAEHHELVSMKSAGVSLPKIIAPLVILVLMISGAAFFFANNILPIVNLKMDALLYDIQTTKPALNIQPDVFYNGITGYSIRIGEKDADQETLHDIKIYDHTEENGNSKVVIAKWGSMKMSSDQRYLLLTLHDGTSYEEVMDNMRQRVTHPMMENHFQSQTIYFDLSSFRFTRTNLELFKNNYDMLNLKQLKASADSMERNLDSGIVKAVKVLDNNYVTCKNYPSRNLPFNHVNPGYPEQNNMNILDAASNIARNARQYVHDTEEDHQLTRNGILRRRLEEQHKVTFPVSCFILFLIGAPLGAIIRKGGLGMPVIVSALFFILYYILSTLGEKMAREEAIGVFAGAWISAAILLPVGIFFTYKASVDSALFYTDAYVLAWNKIKRIFIKG